MRDVRRQLLMRLEFDKKLKEFAVEIRDFGIGQPPSVSTKRCFRWGARTRQTSRISSVSSGKAVHQHMPPANTRLL